MTLRIMQGTEAIATPVIPETINAEGIAAMPLERLEAFLEDVNDEDLSPILKRALSMLAGKTVERPRRALIKRWLKTNVYSEGFRRRR